MPERVTVPGEGSLPRIILFLKAPREGWVKTRLAASVGSEQAVRIYRYLVERQLANLPAGWPVEIRYTPSDAEPEMREWIGNGPIFRPQSEGDLGDRMGSAVAEAFSTGAGPVVCIGADCPDLGAADFLEVRERFLRGADLVFGPAADGGYYLLGLNAYCPEVFTDISWSTSDTLTDSLEKARKESRKVELLDTQRDVDNLEDWKDFCSRKALSL